jgi:hypothetical protein
MWASPVALAIVLGGQGYVPHKSAIPSNAAARRRTPLDVASRQTNMSFNGEQDFLLLRTNRSWPVEAEGEAQGRDVQFDTGGLGRPRHALG